MRSMIIALAACLLAGCATKTVYVDRVVEVKVPVAAPCMGQRPTDEVALRDQIGREQWDALSTDQRANLLAAQALARKVYGDKLTDAAAGCK